MNKFAQVTGTIAGVGVLVLCVAGTVQAAHTWPQAVVAAGMLILFGGMAVAVATHQ